MKTMLKNVLVVDGSGWFPYWGDVVFEDGVVTYIANGENTILDQEPSMDEIIDYKDGDYTLAQGWKAYLVPGIDAPMDMAKFEKQLEKIIADEKAGKPIEKSVREMTGFGYDKIEFLKAGSPADFMLVDRKPVTKILAAYADGKKIS
ncbi:MAG: hypothetical protein IJ720_01510 [Clostridia bacterium]|nr:hypothetical protein [Clostridia bacterium]MBQ8469139.1 hypothetical protein [Clostridia bacterium]MBR1704023.1 hypothetical protein [Clostridia bacterium]